MPLHTRADSPADARLGGGEVKWRDDRRIRKNTLRGQRDQLHQTASGGELIFAREVATATCSVAANRCDLIETSGKIAKTGPLTAPADDCSDSPPDVKFRSVLRGVGGHAGRRTRHRGG